MSTQTPVTKEQLFAKLDGLGIAHKTVDHAPAHTVEEARRHRGDLPGGHCKNLFLKDKKGRLFLVVALEDRAIDVQKLAKQIGAARLSFGKPELLRQVLGVEPGSVTPFALLNDRDQRVQVVLDKEMLDHEILNYHPLKNDGTTALTAADLQHFIRACGHRPVIVDFAEIEQKG